MRSWECLMEQCPEQAATCVHRRFVSGTEVVVAINLAQRAVGPFIRGQRHSQ